MSAHKLPKLIMLYGPPGSGKGVQTELLCAKFGLQNISWGESFRDFVAKHAEDDTSSDQQRAKRVREYMLKGLPILTEDMMYILQQRIVFALQNSDQSLIMDKPGSLPPEAQWISDFLVQHNLSNCLIHFTLPFEISLNRVASRYYVPSDPREIPYKSFEEAKSKCKEGEEPIKRQDDSNLETLKHRYYDLYESNKQTVLNIYKHNNLTKILEIDANDSIDSIFAQIVTFLEENY